ncbi:MAG: transcriptional regulator [Planctomycetota bacterium]
MELCAEFPLVPLTTKRELRAAEIVMDRLAVMDEDRMVRAEEDYLAVLTDLYEAAETKLFGDEIAELNRKVSKISGVDALRFLLNQNGLTGSDLGRMLGNRQLGNAILRGDRQLSKDHIRILTKRFTVSADLFLAE